MEGRRCWHLGSFGDESECWFRDQCEERQKIHESSGGVFAFCVSQSSCLTTRT